MTLKYPIDTEDADYEHNMNAILDELVERRIKIYEKHNGKKFKKEERETCRKQLKLLMLKHQEDFEKMLAKDFFEPTTEETNENGMNLIEIMDYLYNK